MAAIEGYILDLSAMASVRSEVDLTALVETQSGTLYRVAYSVLRNAHEAEDVVQDAFVRVLEHRRTLPQVREMRVWLIRIAWNLALDRRRRVRPDQLDAEFARSLVAQNQPADLAIDESRRLEQVLAELERLPRAERDALLLSATDELSTPEIATILDKSESAIRALLFRARVRLRQRLEAKGGKR